MADELDHVAEETGIGRRAFLRRVLVGTAFATPVVASFAMGGVAAAAPGRSPVAPLLPFCNTNQNVIGNSNTTSTDGVLISNANQNTGGDFFLEEFIELTQSICGKRRY